MEKIMEKLKEIAPNINTDDINSLSDDDFKKLQVQWYNENEGHLNKKDGIECTICKNKGLIQRVDEEGYVVTRHCECMKKRNLVQRAKNSGLGEYLDKRAKDYKQTKDWQIDNYKLMVDYCKGQPDLKEWFTLCGQSGSGKTLLGSIIANHLLFNLGKEVIYITWTDFISKLKRDMMETRTGEVSKYFEEIKNVEILFIDELLKKYNETDLKYIIEIINYRYTNNLKTIITSERDMGDLIKIDEATFGRVVEKSGKYLINVKYDRNKNYRLKNMEDHKQYWQD